MKDNEKVKDNEREKIKVNEKVEMNDKQTKKTKDKVKKVWRQFKMYCLPSRLDDYLGGPGSAGFAVKEWTLHETRDNVLKLTTKVEQVEQLERDIAGFNEDEWTFDAHKNRLKKIVDGLTIDNMNEYSKYIVPYQSRDLNSLKSSKERILSLLAHEKRRLKVLENEMNEYMFLSGKIKDKVDNE